MNYMLIWRFFKYFADFWANFCDFLMIFFVLLPQLVIEKTSIT